MSPWVNRREFLSDSSSVLFRFLSSFLSYLFEKYLEHFSVHSRYLRCVHIFFYTVDTGVGDGAANFAQLDSDYSEPGKHV